MLRLVAGRLYRQEPRGVRERPPYAERLETDVAEAFDGDADGVAEGPLLSDGYRHLDVERQGGAAVEEAQHCGQQRNRWHESPRI